MTTTCEMYAHHQVVAEAALEAGIRCLLTPGIFEFPGAGPDGSWQRFLADAEDLFDRYDGHHPLLTTGFGPHSSYVLPPEALAAVAEAAGRRGALVQIHLAETSGEDDGVRAAHGCSAPALLDRLGVLECRVLAAHSVWLDDADLDLYAAARRGGGPLPHLQRQAGQRRGPGERHGRRGASGWGWGPTGRPPTTASTCGRRCGWPLSWPAAWPPTRPASPRPRRST